MGEEHNGEVGGSKVEGGRAMVGELSSRGVRKRAREDVVAGIREDRKDKKMAKVSFPFHVKVVSSTRLYQ